MEQVVQAAATAVQRTTTASQKPQVLPSGQKPHLERRLKPNRLLLKHCREAQVLKKARGLNGTCSTSRISHLTRTLPCL
jgi:hypothetical protein